MFKFNKKNFILKLLLSELRQHIAGLFVILCLIILFVGLEALAPWPFKFLIDNVLGNKPLEIDQHFSFIFAPFKTKESLGYFVIFLFFMTSILTDFTEFIHSSQIKRIIRDMVYDFSAKAFSNFELFEMGFFKEQEVGDYIYRLSYDVSAIGDLLEHGILPIVTSLFYFMITSVVMFMIDVRLTLMAFMAIPVLVTGLYFFNKKIVKVTKHSEVLNSEVFSFVQEALTQLKMIQAFLQEKVELKKFNRKMKKSLIFDLKLFNLNFLLTLMIGFVIAASYSIVIGGGVNFVFGGKITTGILIVFIFYLDNLTTPILEVIDSFAIIKEMDVKINRMEEFFEEKNHISNTGTLSVFEDYSVEFKNVALRGEQNDPILDDVSFKAPSGKLTVIVGASGSGKTSIISLIPRLIGEPDSGNILIGGRDIREYSVYALRSQITFVPQENTIFNDTIKNIISFGDNTKSLIDIEKAAELAHVTDFIYKHKHGFDFKVGEGGMYLSGGQRQRLMIARAFLKDSKIVIMDEPLSSLDIKTRMDVWNNIQRFSKDRTTIIVTNVLDVIKSADNIIVINEGKVIYSGNHSDLLNDSNLYTLILSKS